jgi:iron complex transport system substrate-binding protein
MSLSQIQRNVLILLFVFPGWTPASIGIAGVVQTAEKTPLLSSPSTFPISVVDDRGHDIRLDHFANRIISLSPNITELVFSAGAGSKLVGVSRYSDFPDAAKSVPDVGDSSSLDLEIIIALKPDLVIAWRGGNAQSDIEKLEKLGLTVFAVEATRLEDIPRLLRTTGKLTGTITQAEPAARAYEQEWQQIKRNYGDRRKISVFQLIWHQPLMTVNGKHVISDIINICGGVNIFESAPFITPVISAENLLEADPHAIISSVSFELAETGVNALFRRFPHIRAVRSNHLFFVHPDLLHRQTVRNLQAAKTVCAQLESVRTNQEKKMMRRSDDWSMIRAGFQALIQTTEPHFVERKLS